MDKQSELNLLQDRLKTNLEKQARFPAITDENKSEYIIICKEIESLDRQIKELENF